MSELRFRRQPHIVVREVAGETVLVPLGVGPAAGAGRRDADFFVLNESGARLWEWLDSTPTRDELVRKLMDEFDVSASSAAADVTEFLDSLLTIDAISPVGE